MELKTTTLKPGNEGKYDRAKKKVDAIKGFHSHLTAFIIINILILLLRANLFSFLNSEKFDINFEEWLDWNIYLTPVLWGIGLIIHGLVVYRYNFGFLKSWEERKMKEYMEKDKEENKKYNN